MRVGGREEWVCGGEGGGEEVGVEEGVTKSSEFAREWVRGEGAELELDLGCSLAALSAVLEEDVCVPF